MKRRLAQLLLALLGAYALLCALVALNQRNFLYFPDANALRDAETIGAETRELATPDGERLIAWWLPPPDAAAPVLLYLHGNGANLDSRSQRLAALREDGFGVLALSWRGYGGSSGSPSEDGWRLDAQAAYDELRRLGVAPGRIVLFGESLGSTQAVMLAAEREVGGLLLDSSFDSALALADQRFGWLPLRWLMRDPHRADLAAPRVRAPVLQVHCAVDPVSPLAHAQALHQRLPKARLQVLQDSCHVPSYARYRAEAARFLRAL